MNEGYIKLHRKTLDSRVFQNEGLLKIWIWCLLKANHKGKWVSIKTGKGISEVWIEPGQFIFGKYTAGKELKMPPSTVWKRINKLCMLGNLVVKSNHQYSTIIIVNWDVYQEPKEISDHQGTTEEPPSRPNKNDKNDKNDEKKKEREKKTSFRHNVLLTTKDHDTLIEKHGEQKTKWLLDKLSLAKETHGYKYKSDYGAINMWVVKAWDKEGGQDQEQQSEKFPLYGSPEWKERYPEG